MGTSISILTLHQFGICKLIIAILELSTIKEGLQRRNQVTGEKKEKGKGDKYYVQSCHSITGEMGLCLRGVFQWTFFLEDLPLYL